MVSIEQLKDKIHEEEMREITKQVIEQSRINREKSIAREKMLSGPTDYIDLLRKSKVPINQTDIKEAVNPTKSKILEKIDWHERLLETHAKGYMHGMYLRIGVFSVLYAILMWL